MDRREIITYIAKKHNISLKEVEKVVDLQFGCVAHVFKKGEAEQIRLPYFGKFDVSPYRLKKLKEKTNGKGLRKLQT